MIQKGKSKSLGQFVTQEEAAKAYDRALVPAKGITAQTNFDITRYVELLSALQPDHTLPHLQTAPHSSASLAVSHPFPDRE